MEVEKQIFCNTLECGCVCYGTQRSYCSSCLPDFIKQEAEERKNKKIAEEEENKKLKVCSKCKLPFLQNKFQITRKGTYSKICSKCVAKSETQKQLNTLFDSNGCDSQETTRFHNILNTRFDGNLKSVNDALKKHFM